MITIKNNHNANSNNNNNNKEVPPIRSSTNSRKCPWLSTISFYKAWSLVGHESETQSWKLCQTGPKKWWIHSLNTTQNYWKEHSRNKILVECIGIYIDFWPNIGCVYRGIHRVNMFHVLFSFSRLVGGNSQSDSCMGWRGPSPEATLMVSAGMSLTRPSPGALSGMEDFFPKLMGRLISRTP